MLSSRPLPDEEPTSRSTKTLICKQEKGLGCIVKLRERRRTVRRNTERVGFGSIRTPICPISVLWDKVVREKPEEYGPYMMDSHEFSQVLLV